MCHVILKQKGYEGKYCPDLERALNSIRIAYATPFKRPIR